MTAWTARTIYQSVRPHRVSRLQDFGFTERQAEFLVHVLVYSGVFMERQYCRFAGLTHGRKTYDFLRLLTDRGYASIIMPGKLHTGRMYHVHYKPLYEAIGEPDSRNRRRVALGRYVERLMLLDVVLGDQKQHHWLGTEQDKVAYFRQVDVHGSKVDEHSFPKVVYGSGDRQTTRYFPDKLPIGIERGYGDRHVFVYLVREPTASAFRVFLARHASLLRQLFEWTVRIVVPRQFEKAKSLHIWAFRDDLGTPVPHHVEREFDWYLRVKHGRPLGYFEPPDITLEKATRKFASARFQALERVWLQEGSTGVTWIGSPVLRDQLQLGRGRLEVMVLPHSYLRLDPLVGVA